jgi:hypothetical protein
VWIIGRNSKPEVHFNATYPHPGGSLGGRPARIGLRRVERQQLVERIDLVASGWGNHVPSRRLVPGRWVVRGRWVVIGRRRITIVDHRTPARQGRDLHPRRIQ